MGVQCWGRKGMQVWSLEASPRLQRSSSPTQLSSVPTLLSSSAQVGPQSPHGPLGAQGPTGVGGKMGICVCSRSNKFLLPQSLRQAEPGSSAWCGLRGGRKQRPWCEVDGWPLISCFGDEGLSPGRAWEVAGLLHGLLCLLPRSPDWAGSLPLLLQLHGLSCRVCSPEHPRRGGPAGRLCPGCGLFLLLLQPSRTLSSTAAFPLCPF